MSWVVALLAGAAFVAGNRRSAAPVVDLALFAEAILPGWIISGFGGGLAIPTITGMATAGLPAGASATGSAVLQMSRQVGSVLGTSALVAILGTAVTTGTATAFLHAWWVCVACYLAAACAAAWLRFAAG